MVQKPLQVCDATPALCGSQADKDDDCRCGAGDCRGTPSLPTLGHKYPQLMMATMMAAAGTVEAVYLCS
jgi:hypothetical protein